MSNFLNIKIVRKIFILATLSAGLFFALAINKTPVSANGCCSFCPVVYQGCVENCQSNHPNNPQKAEQCVFEECEGPYIICLDVCFDFC